MYQQGFFEDKWKFINSVKANIIIDRRESLPTKQDEKKIVLSKNECNKPQIVVKILIGKVLLFQRPLFVRHGWAIKVSQL